MTRAIESIKQLIFHYDDDNILFSCIIVENVASPNLDQLSHFYMYAQLVTKIILDLEYND